MNKNLAVADGITRRRALKGLAAVPMLSMLPNVCVADGDIHRDVYRDILKPSLLYAKKHGWRIRRVCRGHITRKKSILRFTHKGGTLSMPQEIKEDVVPLGSRDCNMESMYRENGGNDMLRTLRFIEDCLVMDRDEGINQHPRIKTLVYCVETKQFGYDLLKVAERHRRSLS